MSLDIFCFFSQLFIYHKCMCICVGTAMMCIAIICVCVGVYCYGVHVWSCVIMCVYVCTTMECMCICVGVPLWSTCGGQRMTSEAYSPCFLGPLLSLPPCRIAYDHHVTAVMVFHSLFSKWVDIYTLPSQINFKISLSIPIRLLGILLRFRWVPRLGQITALTIWSLLTHKHL